MNIITFANILAGVIFFFTNQLPVNGHFLFFFGNNNGYQSERLLL